MEGNVVIITPRGNAKFKMDGKPRSFIARMLFNDWREKNPGDYPSIIVKKLNRDECSKLPTVVDENLQKAKIVEIVANECECWIEGVVQDVAFMIEKYWNKLNHK